MSSNALESDDLLNVRLVRMEDVQPSRNLIETCVINNLVFDNECIVNDEDSNIGSMVSIQSEEMVDGNDGDTVTEAIEPLKATSKELNDNCKTTPTDSWPTLEILPGGFIKHADKREEDMSVSRSKNKPKKCKEMMYACAKCSQSFKYLYSLVKHVKWHEDEQKKQNGLNNSAKMSQTVGKEVYQQVNKRKTIKTKSNKKKGPKRRKS